MEHSVSRKVPPPPPPQEEFLYQTLSRDANQSNRENLSIGLPKVLIDWIFIDGFLSIIDFFRFFLAKANNINIFVCFRKISMKKTSN